MKHCKVLKYYDQDFRSLVISSLQQAATNWIEKGILVKCFGDTLHKLNSANLMLKTSFYSKLNFSGEILKRLRQQGILER